MISQKISIVFAKLLVYFPGFSETQAEGLTSSLVEIISSSVHSVANSTVSKIDQVHSMYLYWMHMFSFSNPLSFSLLHVFRRFLHGLVFYEWGKQSTWRKIHGSEMGKLNAIQTNAQGVVQHIPSPTLSNRASLLWTHRNQCEAVVQVIPNASYRNNNSLLSHILFPLGAT